MNFMYKHGLAKMLKTYRTHVLLSRSCWWSHTFVRKGERERLLCSGASYFFIWRNASNKIQ
jgi:hypothetical protein